MPQKRRERQRDTETGILRTERGTERTEGQMKEEEGVTKLERVMTEDGERQRRREREPGQTKIQKETKK